MDIEKLRSNVCEIARGAGELICKKEEELLVYEKQGRANFVTSMDIASQEYIISRLKPLLPEASFFAEESDKNRLLPGYNWVIDPIDGTANFMLGYKHSCISIALVKDGEGILGVVYDPYLDEMYSAIKGCGAYLNGKPICAASRPIESAVVLFGTALYYRELADLTFNSARAVFDMCGDVRRSGSAALDLCYVASGKCDAYFEILIQPWDYAAGMVIAREAGATVKGLMGKPLDLCSPVGVVAGVSPICDRIYDIVNEQAELLEQAK